MDEVLVSNSIKGEREMLIIFKDFIAKNLHVIFKLDKHNNKLRKEKKLCSQFEITLEEYLLD